MTAKRTLNSYTVVPDSFVPWLVGWVDIIGNRADKK